MLYWPLLFTCILYQIAKRAVNKKLKIYILMFIISIRVEFSKLVKIFLNILLITSQKYYLTKVLDYLLTTEFYFIFI